MKKIDVGDNLAILILIALICVTSFCKHAIKAHNQPEANVEVVCVPDAYKTITMLDEYGAEEPTREKVLFVMGELGIDHIHIAYAQMALESGHFSSNLSKKNNNYFGMKQPSKRSTVSLGKRNGYASYKNWAWSVFDYALWQREMAKELSEDEYLSFIGSIYAEDTKYTDKIKTIVETL